ncbi:hypothetical protein JCM8208_006074 [Rhodotorula glutinis]
MPLTRSAIHRLHLEQSQSPAPDSVPVSTPTAHHLVDESISSTLVSDDRTRDSASSSSSSSDSDSDLSDDDDSDDDDGDPTAHLSALLARAKDAARARDAQQLKAAHDKRRGAAGDGLAGNDEVVLFGDAEDDSASEEDEQRRDRDDSSTPRASTSRALPPSLSRPLSRSHPLLSSLPSRRPASTSTSLAAPTPTPTLAAAGTGGISLAQDVGTALSDVGATRVVRKGAVVVDGEGSAKGKAREVDDRWGRAPLPQLSKKQLKAKQPHTAGAAWFDMPATPMTPSLKRELDALRLASALDPKRFLRGGAKRDKVGEFFQVGHVVAPSTRATTMSSTPRVQKRGFVEELVENEEAQAYARKKTKEVLAKTMSGRKRQRKGYKGAAGNGGGAGRK